MAQRVRRGEQKSLEIKLETVDSEVVSRFQVQSVLLRALFEPLCEQALEVSKAGIGVDLLAGHDETVDLGIGAAKTFELWLVFDSPRTAHDPIEIAARFQRPLLSGVDAAWTAAMLGWFVFAPMLRAGYRLPADAEEQLRALVRRFDG